MAVLQVLVAQASELLQKHSAAATTPQPPWPQAAVVRVVNTTLSNDGLPTLTISASKSCKLDVKVD